MKFFKRDLTLTELRNFIFEIAKKIGVCLEKVEFKILPKKEWEVAGLADARGIIVIFLPPKKRYNPKHFLYVIIHELAHLYQLQYEDKWGHDGLEKTILQIYKNLGFKIDPRYQFDVLYIKKAAEKEKKEKVITFSFF
jgi:hypothetical protein